MKYIIFYLFWITLIYFVPTAFNLKTSLDDFESLDTQDSAIALFSYGAFIHRSDEDSMNLHKRQKAINLLAALYFTSVVFSLLYFTWMRRRLLIKITELDDKALTPSDYCLMGMNMKFEDYTAQGMKDVIK